MCSKHPQAPARGARRNEQGGNHREGTRATGGAYSSPQLRGTEVNSAFELQGPDSAGPWAMGACLLGVFKSSPKQRDRSVLFFSVNVRDQCSHYSQPAAGFGMAQTRANPQPKQGPLRASRFSSIPVAMTTPANPDKGHDSRWPPKLSVFVHGPFCDAASPRASSSSDYRCPPPV